MRLAPAAALAACLAPSLAVAQRFIAPTNETVTSVTQESQSDRPMHVIYVDNRSTVPITVFSVTLSGCENVRHHCAPRPMKLRVRPGQREVAARVEPANRELGFGYRFSFGWNADSSHTAALTALASGGQRKAQAQLADMQRADSIDRALGGPRVRELTRDDFAALAGRALALRPMPDSVLLAPGERGSVEQVRLLVVDSAGAVLGRTRWLRWQAQSSPAVEFVPNDQLIARSAGRSVLRFELADEAQGLVGRPVASVDVPVRVAYRADPHAPTFAGTAVDADRRLPLACADVALEDSAANVVARARTNAAGAYQLAAPRPGTYRVRVEARGWSPVYAPAVNAGPDATATQEVPVRFTDQLLTRRAWGDPDGFQHASPAAVSTGPLGARAAAAPVMLGGSELSPVLGVLTRGPSAATWAQFVVDSAGRVDLSSLVLTPGTAPAAAGTVRATLPRVRFTPARAAGRPTCELVRMEVRVGAPR